MRSLSQVRDFVDNLKAFTVARPAINHLICNAAGVQSPRISPHLPHISPQLTITICVTPQSTVLPTPSPRGRTTAMR